jgi:hypothetical protein
LLDVAETEGFEVLITTDLNLRYQQNLQSRRIAIVALSSPSWLRIQRAIPMVVRAVDGASPGSYIEVGIPCRCARHAVALMSPAQCGPDPGSLIRTMISGSETPFLALKQMIGVGADDDEHDAADHHQHYGAYRPHHDDGHPIIGIHLRPYNSKNLYSYNTIDLYSYNRIDLY